MNKLKLTGEQIISLLDGMCHYESMQYMDLSEKSDKAKTPEDKKFYYEESELHFFKKRTIQFFEKEFITILDLIFEYKEQDKIRHLSMRDIVK